jgi:hypothetical protein
MDKRRISRIRSDEVCVGHKSLRRYVDGKFSR